jgi:DMSO reductase family type II enzyme chaperone
MKEEIVAQSPDGYGVSSVYLFLARCFSYPTEESYKAMKGLDVEISNLVEGLPFEVDFNGIPAPSLSQEEIENEYINAFDLMPLCPPYESSYREDVHRDIYEELFRFFDHFAIRLNDRAKDFPDHLVVELEFMSYLAQQQAQAEEVKKDTLPFLKAQRDFLERHLALWIPRLNERIHEYVREPFYRGVSASMTEFLQGHLEYLRKICSSERTQEEYLLERLNTGGIS